MEIKDLLELGNQFGFLPLAIIYAAYKLKDPLLKYVNLKIDNSGNEKYIGDPYILHKFVSGMVWEASRGKLSQIRGILMANHIKGREEEIKMKIRNLLEERTMVYIDYFNNDIICKIDRLGDFYCQVFDMETFFAQVMDVVYQEREEELRYEQVAVAIEDISNIMVSYQRAANNDLLEKALHLYNKK